MPVPTPFFPRTSQLCTSMFWKEWAGYYAVRSYETCHEREYFALRHAVGLIDVTPLYKYEVYGPDAGALLARVMAKDIRKLNIGQVTYCCWCDDFGKVMDDGTVARLEENYYRVTAAEPSRFWFDKNARGYEVTIEDSSERLAALAVQGPNARAVLSQVCDKEEIHKLGFFRLLHTELMGHKVVISRTGYTGDLGYEIWLERDHALPIWDAVMSAGKAYGIAPVGLDAMDVARIEAGFIMNGVDYFSAHHCLLESRKSSPFEIGLGWTVNLERESFIGQAALQTEKRQGSPWALVGLVYQWDAFEALCSRFDLPPQVSSQAWRGGIPVYGPLGRQIGYATSGAWSPTLKQNLALATLESGFQKPGTTVDVEVTVEFQRHKIPATVTKTPFFNPQRKRA